MENAELKGILKSHTYITSNKENIDYGIKNYETNIFNRNTDYCPIEYYGKDIIYFLKFQIPINLYSKYISKYPNIENDKYKCIEFGVTSDLEKRLGNHHCDKKKCNLVFIHALEINKRYTASKMEFYIKRIVKQLNIKFDYEKRKESVIVNEKEFNILVHKIKNGLDNLYIEGINEDKNSTTEENNTYDDEKDNENIDILKNKSNIEKEIKIKELELNVEKEKINKEIELKKIETLTDLLKNNLISLDDYKNILKI